MRLRRRRLLSALRPDEICPTLVNFPHFGVGDFACFGDGSSPGAPGGPIARSASVPDDVIHPHPRFATLTANIRERRGETVRATPPRFFDEKTPADANPHVEGVDAMAYGMGACCLQVTFQARDATEARYRRAERNATCPLVLPLTCHSRGLIPTLQTSGETELVRPRSDPRARKVLLRPARGARAGDARAHGCEPLLARRLGGDGRALGRHRGVRRRPPARGGRPRVLGAGRAPRGRGRAASAAVALRQHFKIRVRVRDRSRARRG